MFKKHLLLAVLLLFECFWFQFSSFAQDQMRNEVVGEPTVSCSADAIYVKFRTRGTFLGHVDVKYTPDKSCFQSLVTNNQIEVLIPHEECMVARRRSFHPTGVILEAAFTVSFHPEFTTIDDRTFNLQCFHQNKVNGSLSQLLKGSSTPPSVDSNGPSCSYQVESFPGGPPVGRLALGESVYHSWICQNVYESCIIIENCDLVGGDTKHTVIDAEGCSKYQQIMPQLDYHNNTSAGVQVKVFGVSHSPIVYFSCQIRLHPQLPSGECPTPRCGVNERKRRQVDQLPFVDVRSQNLEISQLVNATLHNQPVPMSCDVETIRSEMNTQTAESEDERKICADFRSILVITIVLTIGSIIITSIVVFLIVRRQKYEIANMT